MIEIVDSIHKIKYHEMMQVYESSILESASRQYGNYSRPEGILLAEQDLYSYIQDFLMHDNGVYLILSDAGMYISALRLERFLDGFLIAGLETKPGSRNKGFARQLLEFAISLVEDNYHVPLYAHILKTNQTSISVHEKCGFSRILNISTLLDGSVSDRLYTYCYKATEM